MRLSPGPAACLGALTGLVAIAGCSSPGSADMDTDAMQASVVVVVGERASQVSVVLSSPSMSSVELQGDDRLVATAGSETATLDHQSVLDMDSYAARLDGVADTDAEVTVALRRGDGDASAPGSVVELPGPIYVVQPAVGAEVPRGQDVTVGLTGGTGSVRVEWSGSCLTEGSIDVAEDQPVIVPAGSVRPSAGDDTPASCPATWTVSKISTGQLDPAYSGGSITAQRSVSVALTSVP